MSQPETEPLVGPVLQASALSSAVASAIKGAYPDARIVDRGGYLRVLVPRRCELSRAAVERESGVPFQLPLDLERIMTSFQGRFSVDADRAIWGGRRMKTYEHLLPLKRVPTEYEIASTDLLYYPRRGFEVEVPVSRWYEKYQRGSPFQCGDWEKFADPRQTTYARYVTLQKSREAYLDGLLQSIDDSGYDRGLPPGSLARMERVVAPLRYPLHGLQMVASYIGSMAPGGRIAIAALLQAGDEVGRIQRIAYRTAQLRHVRPGFGATSRTIWETDAAWQPLREIVERLLVTYDWGHAFVALNLCVKPALDDFLLTRVAARAREDGDYQLAELLFAFREDSRWQRSWTDALVRVATEKLPQGAGRGEACAAAVSAWSSEWRPRAEAAIAALDGAVGGPP